MYRPAIKYVGLYKNSKAESDRKKRKRPITSKYI